jgi:hypothetical protein
MNFLIFKLSGTRRIVENLMERPQCLTFLLKFIGFRESQNDFIYSQLQK